MDSIKLEKLITENMRSIFGFALTRLGNVNEAEYLASDILYEIIRAAENLKDEARFYGFMWKIAENTYMDYFRKRSRIVNRTAELNESIVDESDSVLDNIIKKENLNLLRRELSLLSKQYRKATVLYYVNLQRKFFGRWSWKCYCNKFQTDAECSTLLWKYGRPHRMHSC